MKELNEMTKEELKVEAYDLMVQIESLRQRLLVVNQTIQTK